ncbi:MAG: HAD family hydrolase, partial [Thermoleophilia bacterium]
MAIRLIGVDADDTLWHSEGHFDVTQREYEQLLAPWVDAETVAAALLETERRNLAVFGYGVKGFTLSMVESAVTLTGGRIVGVHVERILDLGM